MAMHFSLYTSIEKHSIPTSIGRRVPVLQTFYTHLSSALSFPFAGIRVIENSRKHPLYDIRLIIFQTTKRTTMNAKERSESVLQNYKPLLVVANGETEWLGNPWLVINRNSETFKN